MRPRICAEPRLPPHGGTHEEHPTPRQVLQVTETGPRDSVCWWGFLRGDDEVVNQGPLPLGAVTVAERGHPSTGLPPVPQVSHIESRIEALRAAGLTVQPAGRPRKCQLPVSGWPQTLGADVGDLSRRTGPMSSSPSQVGNLQTKLRGWGDRTKKGRAKRGAQDAQSQLTLRQATNRFQR